MKIFLKVLIIIGVLSVSHITYASDSQSLSVTPPLFQISTNPGDVWQSSVKVVNSNDYPLTVYVDVVNFAANGEGGQGRFIPIDESDTHKSTLGEWVTIDHGPFVIDPEKTYDIPYFVEVPKDAAPGGHYAALIVSTQEKAGGEKMSVLTSQAVTSLLFMRVEGDVVEDGVIREFTVEDSFLDTPEAEFKLRFENKGNVHLQPRGEIAITNMWGTERGVIPINNQTHFGNVLPSSIRDFNFSWKSDFSITDIGRYKAEVTLAYGEDGVKSVSSATYFWVIPVKWTLITLAVLGFFIWLVVVMIRAYVKRMLLLAGVDPKRVNNASQRDSQNESHHVRSYRQVSAPIRDGVIDLRRRLEDTHESQSTFEVVISFIKSYRWFFISIVTLIAIFVTVTLYISRATDEGKRYDVLIKEGDSVKTIKSEDIQNTHN